jgi:hypothetical protein
VDTVPLWLVALVVAVAAPWGVAALQAVLERRLRRRTADVLGPGQPRERERNDTPDGLKRRDA